MSSLLAFVILAAVAALGYAAINFSSVKKLEEGTPRMKEIAKKIREGADTFIKYELKIILMVAVFVVLALGLLVSWECAVAFLIGAAMSECAGFVGMRIATYANVRVANTARITKNLGQTLKVAFKGGSVMGLCVGGFAMLGLFIVYILFGAFGDYLTMEKMVLTPAWIVKGIEFVPFTMIISGYALGCSMIAMFNRVGGGIYTKAADMGADLVGKTEAHIPEDDPRNPATIADNVGDNVGDVAGLGSDLLESYVGAISSAIILGVHLFLTSQATAGTMTTDMLQKLFYYPLVFAGVGLISCVIGIASLLMRKLSDNPHRELNNATWISAGITIVLGGVVTYFFFKDMDLGGMSFSIGMMSPWLSAVVGIVAGIVIGMLAEYYTSYDYKPTRKIAESSIEGPALTITEGMAVGMKSTMAPLIVLAAATMISYFVAGMYGVAMAAVGMLSFVTVTVSVDTYGPISDNAGGIAEMSALDPEVREITDKLDSVGNTTAAIGKGFAIGSASLAALSLMVSFLYSFNDPSTPLQLNIVNTTVLAGGLVGAEQALEELRAEIPGILEGKADPDHKTCIQISSASAIHEMKLPAILSLLFPIVAGFLFGANFVGGVLIGATLSAIMLAIFTGNAGGAWDNGKKFIELGGVKGAKKGDATHEAAVVGDTVGDPLKDTVGPSLDILIKIMSTVSLILVSIFSKYNVLDWIMSLFK